VSLPVLLPYAWCRHHELEVIAVSAVAMSVDRCRVTRNAVLLCCALLAPAASAEELPRALPETVGMSSTRLERLSDKMQSYVDRRQLPGAVTMVARHGKVVQFEQYGMMDAENGKEMRRDALFRIYSMTKPVTGVAVMILFEEGRFLLTDPVAKYLPEFETLRVYVGGSTDDPETEPARPITIEQLLTHTSGLAYDDPGPGVNEMYREADLWTVTSLQGFIEKLTRLPLLYQPGTRWHYSVSMDVLGRLVEVVAGQPFDRFLAERIFEPLGMVDTGFSVPPENAVRLTALYHATPDGGYERVAGPRTDSARDPDRVPFGGGGLISSATDYLRFAQMLTNGGELGGVRILGRKTVDLMFGDHLGSRYGSEPLAGFEPWLQSNASGVGFGYTGAVVTDPALSGLPGTVGQFFWGGWASTFFFVDREEQLVGMILAQLIPSDAYPLRADARILTYQALVD
jgi:CubicO group peptidase (beta-lactamase class C family)